MERPGGRLTGASLLQSVDEVKLVPPERQDQGQENCQQKAQPATPRDPGGAASFLETAPCLLGSTTTLSQQKEGQKEGGREIPIQVMFPVLHLSVGAGRPGLGVQLPACI